MSRSDASYPTKALIERTVNAARAAGVTVSGIEVLRDGTIRILSAVANDPSSSYDRWRASKGQ
jgi:hypothetical protein